MITPACKSARTLVVPPGVEESLRGEGGGGFREFEDVVGFNGEGDGGAREEKDESAAPVEFMIGVPDNSVAE